MQPVCTVCKTSFIVTMFAGIRGNEAGVQVAKALNDTRMVAEQGAKDPMRTLPGHCSDTITTQLGYYSDLANKDTTCTMLGHYLDTIPQLGHLKSKNIEREKLFDLESELCANS